LGWEFLKLRKRKTGNMGKGEFQKMKVAGNGVNLFG
jgi:hypothetical protein